MLALLLAPRGRISAARVAAQARLRRQAEARRTVARLPEAPTARASGSTAAKVRDADPEK
jgi:hypothetical protein